MITEAVFSAGLSLVRWFVTLIPSVSIPSWFASVGTSVNQFFTSSAGLGPFVDWAFLAVIAAVPLGLWSVGMLFQLGGKLLRHIPFFGGR